MGIDEWRHHRGEFVVPAFEVLTVDDDRARVVQRDVDVQGEWSQSGAQGFRSLGRTDTSAVAPHTFIAGEADKRHPAVPWPALRRSLFRRRDLLVPAPMLRTWAVVASLPTGRICFSPAHGLDSRGALIRQRSLHR